MENVDFLKSMLFPKKNHTFSCPRAPKSHQNRAQTPSQTNFDDILRPKSFEETPWSDHMAVRTLPGTPKERPRGPQGPPRAAKAIFAPPGFDPFLHRVLWSWDFCYIFIQKCGFRVGGVAFSPIRQTLRFAPPQESFALSLHAKHAGTAKGMLHVLRHAKEGFDTPGATSARRIWGLGPPKGCKILEKAALMAANLKLEDGCRGSNTPVGLANFGG